MSTPDGLARILASKNTIPEGWADAVGAVPRELFIPDVIEVGDEQISRTIEPDRWRAVVYDDVPVTTQVNDGQTPGEGAYRLPTSSSSMPTVMLEMLELLDLQPGQRVLEAGTGTGFNAAWLSHRLGSDHVTSIDIDAALVAQAAKNLASASYSPRLVVGDAGRGCPDNAPYDAVLATYTVPEIPYAWVEQAPHGRIVAPWGGSFFSHSYAALHVTNSRATGRFTGWPAFMRTRVGRPHRGYLSDFHHHHDTGTPSRTSISPRTLASDADALFFVGLALPDAWYLYADARDDSGQATMWILADDRRSWATVEYEPGTDDYQVAQFGPRTLWDEAENAYRWWEQLGSPTRDQSGLTITPAGQTIWLHEPANTLRPPMAHVTTG